MIKFSKKAKEEQETYKLLENSLYLECVQSYAENYSNHPPSKSVPNRNMLKALRIGPWNNSVQEWARLHVCESFLKSK
jgi:hypothetical protein